MFGNLKSLVDKNKQNKQLAATSSLVSIARPLIPAASSPTPTVASVPDTLASIPASPVPKVTPPTTSAPLGSILFNRLLFIDECLLSYAKDALDTAQGGDVNERLLLSTPSLLEACSWSNTYLYERKMKDAEEATRRLRVETNAAVVAAPSSVTDEPCAKKSRTEGSSSESGEKDQVVSDTPGAANPAADYIQRISALVSTLSTSSPTNPLTRNLLRGLFSMDSLIDKAAAAETDAQSLNAAITQQGQQDESVTHAVLMATQRAALAAAQHQAAGNDATRFEITSQAEATIASVLTALANGSSVGSSEEDITKSAAFAGNAANIPAPPATDLISSSNLYTILLLVVERATILREVIAYQHRWLVSEARRVAALRSNSLVVSRDQSQNNEAWPTNSSYTTDVKWAMKVVNGVLAKSLGGGTSSSTELKNAISAAYTVIFNPSPAAKNASATPHMLMEAVKAPTAAAEKWIGENATTTVAIGNNAEAIDSPASRTLPEAFPTGDVYRQALQSSKGDLRARLQVIVDTLEGFGRIVEALQRDAVAINVDGPTSEGSTASSSVGAPPSNYSTRINLVPSGNYQRQQLIEGKVSLALPEKLRTVVVSIGTQMAGTLTKAYGGIDEVNAMVSEVAAAAVGAGLGNAVAPLPPPIQQRLSALRSTISSRTLSTEDVYFSYTIGNEKWSMGIVGDSLHMRRSLEKIQNLKVAHVMNNTVVQGSMLSLKRLITFVGTEYKLEARVK